MNGLPRLIARPAAPAAILAAVCSSVALGGGGTWNGGGANNNWSTNANWTPASPGVYPVPNDAGAIYQFAGTTRLSPNVDQTWLTSRLQFNATGFTITASSGVTLSLAGTNNGQILNNNGGTYASVISAPIAVVAATGGVSSTGRTIDTNTGSIALNGGIDAGTFNLIKIGAGTLTLPTANTFASGTQFGINNGFVRVGNNAALGSATIVHNDSGTGGFTVPASTNVNTSGANTVRLVADNPAVPVTLNNAVNLGGSGVFLLSETATNPTYTPVMTLAGTVTIAGSKPVNVETNSVAEISGNVVNGTSTGGISKGNPGTLILSGTSNTYSGGVTLNVGAIRAGSDTAFGQGTISFNSSVATETSAVGNRAFANAVTLGGVNTVTFGQAGFANGNMTFNGNVSLSGLNANATAGDADDLKALSVASGVTTTFNGNITEVNASSGLAKFGPGTLLLAGTNTFTGGVTVNSGTVHITGSNTSNLSVPAGKASGTGTVRVLSVYDGTADSTANGGTLSPGTDTTAGTFSAGRADFADGGNYLFNLTNAAGTAGSGWDLLNLTGVGTANGNLNVTAGSGGFTLKLALLDPAFNATQDQVFQFVQALGVLNFAANDILVDTSAVTVGGGAFMVAQDGNNLNLVYTAAPEPATWLSASIGAAGVAMTRRRRACSSFSAR